MIRRRRPDPLRAGLDDLAESLRRLRADLDRLRHEIDDWSNG